MSFFVTNKNVYTPVSRKRDWLLFIVFLWVICSQTACHNPSNTTSDTLNTGTSKTSIMGVYSSLVNPLKLPFTDTCFNTVPTQQPQLPDSLEKFKTYGKVMGKVYESKHYVAILYAVDADVQLPVLRTFNERGEKISSLRLFIGDCCGENEACSGLSTATITQNMHIILKDSMQTFDRDKKKFDKKKNVQIFKKYLEYRIDSTGKIIQLGLRSTKELSVRRSCLFT